MIDRVVGNKQQASKPFSPLSASGTDEVGKEGGDR
jgi:hypothetical protein